MIERILAPVIVPLLFAVTALGQIIVGRLVREQLLRRLPIAAFPVEKGRSVSTVQLCCDLLLGLVLELWCIVLVGSALHSVPELGDLFRGHPRVFPVLALLGMMFPALYDVRGTTELMRSIFERLRGALSIHTVLWFAVILAVGVTLFDDIEGIRTPWVNNYGDLAFHLGMITGFARGANFPPEYVVYAGETLSYPFFINLWSAVLWAPWSSFLALDQVCTWQWVLLWMIVFWLLPTKRWPLLPWAILFGGGSYNYLFAYYLGSSELSAQNLHAHAFLGNGYPWAPFLTTMWVTQRPIVLGAALCIAATRILTDWLESTERTRGKSSGGNRSSFLVSCLQAGVLLGLGALAHTHMALVGAMYSAMVYLLVGLKRVKRDGWRELQPVILFVVGLSSGVLALPFIWGKRGILQLTAGWMPWKVTDTSSLPLPAFGVQLIDAALMWANNAWPFLLLLTVPWALTRRHTLFFPLAVIFILANTVQLSVWDWDQLKVFLAIYLTGLMVLSTVQFRWHWVVQPVLVIFLIPAAFETGRAYFGSDDYVVYSEEDLRIAEDVVNRTDSCAVFIAKPDHNSALTLTGRRMHLGYGGTLHSHGIDYLLREQAQSGEFISFLQGQRSDPTPYRACGRFVLRSPREQSLWPFAGALEQGLLKEVGSEWFVALP